MLHGFFNVHTEWYPTLLEVSEWYQPYSRHKISTNSTQSNKMVPTLLEALNSTNPTRDINIVPTLLEITEWYQPY